MTDASKVSGMLPLQLSMAMMQRSSTAVTIRLQVQWMNLPARFDSALRGILSQYTELGGGEGATKCGRGPLVDSRGYSYDQRKVMSDYRIDWECTVHTKYTRCRVGVKSLKKDLNPNPNPLKFFQIQIKSKSFLFQKDLNPNPNPFLKRLYM